MARIGWHAKVYIGGVLCDLVQDLTYEESVTEVESRNRSSRYVKFLKGLRTKPIDFDMTTDATDPGYLALEAAYRSDSDDDWVEVEFTDRVKTKTPYKGFKANFIVTKFAQSEPLDDEAKTSVSLRLAAGAPEPVVTSSP